MLLGVDNIAMALSLAEAWVVVDVPVGAVIDGPDFGAIFIFQG